MKSGAKKRMGQQRLKSPVFGKRNNFAHPWQDVCTLDPGIRKLLQILVTRRCCITCAYTFVIT
jgi:hypothetical protein